MVSEMSISISASTFLTIFYIARKLAKTKEEVFSELTKFEILEVTKINCLEGYKLAYNFDDVEDCVELSLAKQNKLSFITADQTLSQKYSRFCQIIFVD